MTTPPDPALRALLRRGDAAADLPAVSADSFAAGVHARIRQADTSAWHGRPARGLVALLARQLYPLAAALAVIASIGAGSAVAYARERDARADVFASAYARSIDPWQMHGASAAGPSAEPAAHRHP